MCDECIIFDRFDWSAVLVDLAIAAVVVLNGMIFITADSVLRMGYFAEIGIGYCDVKKKNVDCDCTFAFLQHCIYYSFVCEFVKL